MSFRVSLASRRPVPGDVHHAVTRSCPCPSPGPGGPCSSATGPARCPGADLARGIPLVPLRDHVGRAAVVTSEHSSRCSGEEMTASRGRPRGQGVRRWPRGSAGVLSPGDRHGRTPIGRVRCRTRGSSAGPRARSRPGSWRRTGTRSPGCAPRPRPSSPRREVCPQLLARGRSGCSCTARPRRPSPSCSVAPYEAPPIMVESAMS